MISRIPKRGFTNANFRKDFQVVNLVDLEERFEDGATVDPKMLQELNLVEDEKKRVKILGTGELKKKLSVTADAFSASASEKIIAAGGSVELRPGPKKFLPARGKDVKPKPGKNKISKPQEAPADSSAPESEG